MKHCPNCGESLAIPTCLHCGAEMHQVWKHCPDCGKPVSVPVEPEAEPEIEPSVEAEIASQDVTVVFELPEPDKPTNGAHEEEQRPAPADLAETKGLSVTLPKEQVAWLDARAKRKGVSARDVLRGLVAARVEVGDEIAPLAMGRGKQGSRDSRVRGVYATQEVRDALHARAQVVTAPVAAIVRGILRDAMATGPKVKKKARQDAKEKLAARPKSKPKPALRDHGRDGLRVAFPHPQILWIEEQAGNRGLTESAFLQQFLEISTRAFSGVAPVEESEPCEVLSFRAKVGVLGLLRAEAEGREVEEESIVRGIIHSAMQEAR